MGFDISGLGDVISNLSKTANDIKNAASQDVPLSELFSDSFIGKYTSFKSFADLLKAGGFIVNNSEDFKAIPNEALDAHIHKTTDFKNLKDMIAKAALEYTKKKIGF